MAWVNHGSGSLVIRHAHEHHPSCPMQWEKVRTAEWYIFQGPFRCWNSFTDDSFIESFHCSKRVYCGLMYFSIVGEIRSKYVKASIKKMCMMNLIFGLGGGPELLGFLNLAFHSNRLENIACFCHLEPLDYQFFLQFTIDFFPVDINMFPFIGF